MEKLTTREPVDIFLVTFKRLNFLRFVIKKIYDRTRYPYRLWVINNGKDDEQTSAYLKQAKSWGYVHDYCIADENKGLASGLRQIYEYAEKQTKGRVSEFFIQTQDDVIPPDLKPCWLERMVKLAVDNDDYGAISMRIERVRRRDIDEFSDLIPSDTACPACLRITKKKIIEEIGFSERSHWESHTFSDRIKKTGLKLAMTTKIYASHIGFVTNKGFEEGYTSYHTYAANKDNQHIDQPYPDIDEKTNIPLVINTSRDRHEQIKREAYWEYWGVDRSKVDKKIIDQQLLEKYAEKGRGIEVGCGRSKCSDRAIGVDVFPFKTVDVLADASDLWMFKEDELDFVIACHSLEHFPDVKRVMKEWKRTLKSGGTMAVVVPDGEARPGVIRGSHKIAFTKEVMRIIMKFDLNMKVQRIENIPGKAPGKECFIAVATKK